MATPTKLPPQGQEFYNKKGQHVRCNNDAEVRNAKDNGYTSAKYVPSYWPTTYYHKKTGAAQRVGKLEWTDEQNQAAVDALGPDYTKEFVPEPAPAKESAARPSDGGHFIELLTELQLAVKRIEELESAVSDLAGVRTALEMRVADLEAVIAEPAAT